MHWTITMGESHTEVAQVVRHTTRRFYFLSVQTSAVCIEDPYANNALRTLGKHLRAVCIEDPIVQPHYCIIYIGCNIVQQ